MKKTKIVATISDSNCSVEFLTTLYNEGMNVVRLNTAHQTHELSNKIVENVRKVSDKIAILVDTKGPEIRTTKCDEKIPFKKGDKVIMTGNPDGITTKETICTTYVDFVKDIPVGSIILIDDGDLELTVTEKDASKLYCEVQNDAVLGSRKSINLPGVHTSLPALNEKDRSYIQWAIDQNIDFIAHSFVRNKEDLMEIQQIIDAQNSDVKIISKIENQEGVNNIDEIIEHSYGIMVARGDLAIELPAEQIPLVQKQIIQKCIERRKPVITATQMLHTMIQKPRPTRAEVSDVANAIYDGTDAIMLSGETAYGDYPVESVRMMTKIALQTEKYGDNWLTKIPTVITNNEVTAFLAKSAVRASFKLDTKAIVTDSHSGRTALALAAYRGKNVIFAQCYDKRTMREMALSYGVYANYMEKKNTVNEFLQYSLNVLLNQGAFKAEDMVIVVAGNFGFSHGASFMEISKVDDMLKRRLAQ